MLLYMLKAMHGYKLGKSKRSQLLCLHPMISVIEVSNENMQIIENFLLSQWFNFQGCTFTVYFCIKIGIDQIIHRLYLLKKQNSV